MCRNHWENYSKNILIQYYLQQYLKLRMISELLTNISYCHYFICLISYFEGNIVLKRMLHGAGDGSVVKNAHYSYRAAKFSSQHPCQRGTYCLSHLLQGTRYPLLWPPRHLYPRAHTHRHTHNYQKTNLFFFFKDASCSSEVIMTAG